MGDFLAAICRSTREEVAERSAGHPYGSLEAGLPAGPTRGFAKALDAAASDGRGLIAEIKRASPSKGSIREEFDPAVLARAYANGGATCLSVLTERRFFKGDRKHLTAARQAVSLPVLCKDFMLTEYQILEARIHGADAVLLILAALDDAQAADLEAAATELGMDVLLEVHDEAELDRALALRSRLIGINNRDLGTFETDLSVTMRLAGRVPADRRVVSESGIARPDDIARLEKAGVRCFLVGESLMRQPDVERATRALLDVGT